MWVWALILAGCGNTITDAITVEFSDSLITVDSDCAGGCIDEELVVTITIDQLLGLDSFTELDLRQYRIDYALSGLSENPPFFADDIDGGLLIPLRSEGSFTATPTGNTQRDWVTDNAAGQANGTATLTIEGYDEDNNLITYEVGNTFEINFSNL